MFSDFARFILSAYEEDEDRASYGAWSDLLSAHIVAEDGAEVWLMIDVDDVNNHVVQLRKADYQERWEWHTAFRVEDAPF